MDEQVRKKLEQLLEKTYIRLADLEANLAYTMEPSIQEEYHEKIGERKQLIEKLELQLDYPRAPSDAKRISLQDLEAIERELDAYQIPDPEIARKKFIEF